MSDTDRKVRFDRNQFEELIQDDWFVDNPNGCDIRDELNAAINAYDSLSAELAEIKAKDPYAENYALTARVRELEAQLCMTNSGWPHEKKLHERIAELEADLSDCRKVVVEYEGAIQNAELLQWGERLAERVSAFCETWGVSQETPVTLKRMREALAEFEAWKKGKGL